MSKFHKEWYDAHICSKERLTKRLTEIEERLARLEDRLRIGKDVRGDEIYKGDLIQGYNNRRHGSSHKLHETAIMTADIFVFNTDVFEPYPDTGLPWVWLVKKPTV